ncbi:MAG: tetratricopeptide repeat protein [Nitrospirae bacterium]|nr:MAG: tetratricopeptide repeat protein [Nitrospirota bacterium]
MIDGGDGRRAPTVPPTGASYLLSSGVGVVVITAALLTFGCVPHAKPPKERYGPAKTVAPTDPTLEIQARLLQDARTFHAQGRYDAAIPVLQRLITAYPRSPLLTDAHWWLARSYEQAGNLDEALAHYRLVAQAVPPGSTGLQARKRVVELEQALRATPAGVKGRQAVLIPAHRLPPPQQLEAWVRALAQAGMTTLVVEAGTGQGQREGNGRDAQPAGVYFQTRRADTVRDVVGQLVPVAHRQGLKVFSSVTLRRMPWLKPQLAQLGWADRVYDPLRGQILPSESPDLFHPAFQDYLVGLLSDLVAGGIDGILFRADLPIGPADGFSPFGLKGFERDFGITLDPATLFPSADPDARSGDLSGLRSAAADQGDYAPAFWRWAGWKSRETLKVMDRLREALRKQSPNLHVALEVHPEAATDPVSALVKFNEDLLESKRVRFDSYVLGGQPAVVGVQPVGLPVIADRMIALIGDVERVWVALPVPLAAPVAVEQLAEGVNPAADHSRFAKGIGLLYVVGTAQTAGSVP